jgi:hypothetical protein
MYYEIRDIKVGRGARSKYTYARLYNSNGELIISATLDYIILALGDNNRFPTGTRVVYVNAVTSAPLC